MCVCHLRSFVGCWEFLQHFQTSVLNKNSNLSFLQNLRVHYFRFAVLFRFMSDVVICCLCLSLELSSVLLTSLRVPRVVGRLTSNRTSACIFRLVGRRFVSFLGSFIVLSSTLCVPLRNVHVHGSPHANHCKKLSANFYSKVFTAVS